VLLQRQYQHELTREEELLPAAEEVTVPNTPPTPPDRILTPMLRRFGPRLAQRPGESLLAYAQVARRLAVLVPTTRHC
jgi:hypothetical protein